jgi:acyl-CoA reductase-like NAD-dependent aldehyde dehydrogenase
MNESPNGPAERRAARRALCLCTLLGGPGAIRPPYVDPIILVDVPEGADAVTCETFGPTLVVNKVRDLDDAVARANGTRYGLGASIFCGDRRRALDVASRLRCGVVTVNSVLGFAAVAALPFGGVGDSGFGRIHGPDGLREFAVAKSIAEQRFKAPLDLLTLERPPKALQTAASMLHLLHGKKRAEPAT